MADTVVETEAFYDILVNAEGDLLFCLKAREGSPDRPQMLFDGKDHALFYRTADQMIVLDYIHPEVSPLLKEVSSVLVAEFSEATPENPTKGIVREYMASVRHVSKLPLADIKEAN
ncbi:MAG: hypothetical protein J5787_00220 [Alphaproteobacteria bacterium]|nr:hypothetical protein [Alphaproteobacteria bacterium]